MTEERDTAPGYLDRLERLDNTRCDCCDLLLSSCGKQIEMSEDAVRRRRRARLIGRGWVPARYHDKCGKCGEYFNIGSLIGKDRKDGWIGACCGPD